MLLFFLLLACASAEAGPLFVDATGEAGLDRPTVSGGPDKRIILDSTGSGAAVSITTVTRILISTRSTARLMKPIPSVRVRAMYSIATKETGPS